MKFLATYDGSSNSAEAVAKAVELAGEIGAELMATLGGPPATILVEAFSYGEDTAAHIAHVAADRGSDMVVIASKRASGVRGLIGGSVAQHVIRLSPCPVFVVRPGM